MNDRFDAIVLGSGSGGRTVAGLLADAGMGVAMVESELVGGECPYWACMPAKSLLRPVEAVGAARRVPGVSARIESWDEVLSFRDDVTSGRDDAEKAARYAERGVTIIRGQGRLAGPGQVEVDGRAYTTERVVIATGSITAPPPWSSSAPGPAAHTATTVPSPTTSTATTRPAVPQIIYYRSGDQGIAARLGADLGIPAIAPTPASAALQAAAPTAQLIVVVGNP
jgi:pyruvate/2-oxoglutarate dehydrogenase complex dihydrolipoamide dehydrogenase (E3) component